MSRERETKTINLTIRVTPSELEHIKRAALERDMPYSEFCMKAIRQYMGTGAIPTREEFQELVERINQLETKIAA